mgnify:CR=1 FL=1
MTKNTSGGMTVAIDGPAAAGKGTVAKAVAAHFGFAHLDTGLLYRAVAAKTLTGMDADEAAQTLAPVDLEDPSLRNPDVAQEASKVAVIPAVRAALVRFQRSFATRAGGAVLDGRDIGTVICPTYETVLEDVKQRDLRDMSRDQAPLKPADDAKQIDTTEMAIEDAVAAAVALIEAKQAERG